MSTQIVGGPSTVRHMVDELTAEAGANELMALTFVYPHEGRVRSYELFAQAMGITSRD